MRWLGIVALAQISAVGSVSALATSNGCTDLVAESEGVGEPDLTQSLLTENQCEAIKTRELRALLLEVPQSDEDPLQLSIGVKNGGATLRLKIPFSL
jgi:hypothetical protein